MERTIPKTVEDVLPRLEAIRMIVNDPEAAHAAEDDLHVDVLRAIVNGASNPIGLAALALTTELIQFDRWHA